MDEDKFGFRGNKCTREVIICLRNIIEIDREVSLSFVDIQKAFGNVEWNVLMDTLKIINFDYRNRGIIKALYKNQIAAIKVKR